MREVRKLAFLRGMVSPGIWGEPGTSRVKGGVLNMPGWTIAVLRDMVGRWGEGRVENIEEGIVMSGNYTTKAATLLPVDNLEVGYRIGSYDDRYSSLCSAQC